jgi:hypothetical protein
MCLRNFGCNAFEARVGKSTYHSTDISPWQPFQNEVREMMIHSFRNYLRQRNAQGPQKTRDLERSNHR